MELLAREATARRGRRGVWADSAAIKTRKDRTIFCRGLGGSLSQRARLRRFVGQWDHLCQFRPALD